MTNKARFLLLVIVGMLVLLVASCKVVQPTVHTSDTVREFYHDTTVRLDAANVTANLDSAGLAFIIARLNAAKQAGKADTVIYRDASGKAALRFYYDSKGQLQANCESAEQMLTLLLKEVNRISTTKTTPPPVMVRVVPFWMWMLLGAAAAIIIYQRLVK